VIPFHLKKAHPDVSLCSILNICRICSSSNICISWQSSGSYPLTSVPVNILHHRLARAVYFIESEMDLMFSLCFLEEEKLMLYLPYGSLLLTFHIILYCNFEILRHPMLISSHVEICATAFRFTSIPIN